MSLIYTMRLINAIESGSITGSQLEQILLNPGKLAAFNVLLSSQGQARRIAAANTTMISILGSPLAISAIAANITVMNAVFNNPTAIATVLNTPAAVAVMMIDPRIITAMYSSNVAMIAVTNNLNAMTAIAVSTVALNSLINNATAWATYKTSAYYSLQSKNLITNLAGLLPNNYLNLTEVSLNMGAMNAIITNKLSWELYKTTPNFITEIKNVITNQAGLVNDTYSSLDVLIASDSAMTEIIGSRTAMMALTDSPKAFDRLIASTSAMASVTASSFAMAIVAASEVAMTKVVVSAPAMSAIFYSIPARLEIFLSTIAVDIIANSSAAISWLRSTVMLSASNPVVPDGLVGTRQPFPTMPAKVLTLSIRQISGVIAYTHTLTDKVAGSRSNVIYNVNPLATEHINTYSNMQWDTTYPGAGAPYSAVIEYVSMV